MTHTHIRFATRAVPSHVVRAYIPNVQCTVVHWVHIFLFRVTAVVPGMHERESTVVVVVVVRHRSSTAKTMKMKPKCRQEKKTLSPRVIVYVLLDWNTLDWLW